MLNNTCPPTAELCMPNGDGGMFLFVVRDQDGDFFDLTGAAEITFLVADTLGGTVRILKTLSDGDIEISGTGRDFHLTLTRDDTTDLVRIKNYFEATVLTTGGIHHTVVSGIFRAPETMNKDLA
jgi:hypothetical protein